MSRRLWIVWLMLALLPMRGWAVASMVMPSAPVGLASEVSSDAQPHHSSSAMAPCHEAAQDDGSGGEATHACTLCDLCHSASSVSPQMVLPAAPVPDALPPPAAARDTGRHAVGGLDRPPRIALA